MFLAAYGAVPGWLLAEIALLHILATGPQIIAFIQIVGVIELVFRKTGFPRAFRGDIAIFLKALPLRLGFGLSGALRHFGGPLCGCPLIGGATGLAAFAAGFGSEFPILREATAFRGNAFPAFPACLSGKLGVL